jgi:N-acetylglutamate synthase-like GNAT family acetyltransferase
MYIREYNVKDKAACLQLFKSNMPVFFADHELVDFEAWLDAMPARKNLLEDQDQEMYFVLEEQGNPVACGGFYVSRDGSGARMCWGMVENSQHKKGYGKVLTRYRLGLIRKLFPHTRIALDTTQHSSGFFEKQGFVLDKITENAYAPGLHRYDMTFNP